MMSQQHEDPPGGHYCPSCGSYIQCDKRRLGGGRKQPITSYGANHSSVLGILGEDTGRWHTVRQLQNDLSQRNIAHAGKHSAWNYVAVQAVVSDLVGWGYAEMRKLPRSREWAYRFVRPKETPGNMSFSRQEVAVVGAIGKTDIGSFWANPTASGAEAKAGEK
jgi:hypothetical protein